MGRSDVKLIFVDSRANHNKYYNMFDLGNGTFRVEYGRVGAAPQTSVYNISQWDTKYQEKIRKGYDDVTENFQRKAITTDYATAKDSEIDTLLRSFLACSRQYVSQFTSSEFISQRGAGEAQRFINLMAKHIDVSTDLDEFNRYLMWLYEIIPRKIANVRDDLCKDLKDRPKYVVREQSLLDNLLNMTQQAQVPQDNDDGTKKTIEETFGFTLTKCNAKETAFIKDKLKQDGFYRFTFDRAWKINTPAREKGFQEYLEDNHLQDNSDNVKMYWHGTGTENILSVLANGLLIKPSNSAYTGSMYGLGIYTAPNADKASNYTSISGGYWKGGHDQVAYMFINAVIMGKQFEVYDNYESYGGIKIYNLDGDKFSSADLGYHSVYAHAGSSLKRDECIVYNQNQVACRYLVAFKV